VILQDVIDPNAHIFQCMGLTMSGLKVTSKFRNQTASHENHGHEFLSHHLFSAFNCCPLCDVHNIWVCIVFAFCSAVMQHCTSFCHWMESLHGVNLLALPLLQLCIFVSFLCVVVHFHISLFSLGICIVCLLCFDGSCFFVAVIALFFFLCLQLNADTHLSWCLILPLIVGLNPFALHCFFVFNSNHFLSFCEFVFLPLIILCHKKVACGGQLFFKLWKDPKKQLTFE